MIHNDRDIDYIKYEITELFNQAVKDARKEALKEVLRMMWARAEMLEKVLNNGHSIWQASTGLRSQQMYVRRSILWTRCILLNEMAGEIIKLMKNK
jgi:hypothetical protein